MTNRKNNPCIIAAILIIFSVLMAFLFATPASAQQLKVATGAASGTYSTMFKELQGKCTNELVLVEQGTNGSVTNVDMLLGNQVNAAFVQTDVLFFRANTEDLSNVKTLIALHPEEVHLVAMSAVKSEGGVMGIGAKTVSLYTVNDLEGRKVGAAGGSFVTAQVIRLQSGIAYKTVQYDNNELVLKALAAGDIDAAVLVGGSPLPLVAGLDPRFKLLGIPEATQTKLKNIYRPARLSYAKMGASGVQSVATEAAFVTREYKTPKMLQALSKFRQCTLNNIDDLRETTGTHPKWQAVKADNRGKWAWYDLK